MDVYPGGTAAFPAGMLVVGFVEWSGADLDTLDPGAAALYGRTVGSCA